MQKENVVMDASHLVMPKKVLKTVSVLEKKFPSGMRVANNKLHNRIKRLVKSEWLTLYRYTREVRKRLEKNNRFVIIRGFPFLTYKKTIRDFLVLALTLGMGKPTPTDHYGKKVIWDVTPKEFPKEYTTTFTENADSATLHTDTQYKSHPERYVAFFVTNPARRGGATILLDGRRVLTTLKKTNEGRKCIKFLQSKKFPFRVPTTFTSKRDESIPEVICAPILKKKPMIRFRLDTILKGFDCYPKLAQKDAKWAVEYFSKHVKTHPEKKVFKLNKGEIFAVNNHEMLHGRTRFSDKDRLLLRVRMERT